MLVAQMMSASVGMIGPFESGSEFGKLCEVVGVVVRLEIMEHWIIAYGDASGKGHESCWRDGNILRIRKVTAGEM